MAPDGFAAAALNALLMFVASLQASLPGLAIVAAVFTAVGAAGSLCNDTPPWWRKADLATDLCYALVMPGLMQFGRLACLLAGLAVFYHATDPAFLASMLDHGRGPLAPLAFWQQAIVYFLAADLILYLTHRAFHTMALWRYHAVHHSSEQLEWISAQRFHPVDEFLHAVVGDCALMLLGVSPHVLIWAVPFTVGMSALAHANLDWTFGPFRYVLTSPVFHRWHHTGVNQGGNSNFAANFPVFDLLFGTFYMPSGVLPRRYGVTEGDVPADFIGQIMHPFRKPRPPTAAGHTSRLSGSKTTPLTWRPAQQGSAQRTPDCADRVL